LTEVSRTAVTLFGWSIHWYGVLITLGVLLGALLGAAREKSLGLPPETALDLVLLGAPAALAGARLYYVLFSQDQFAGLPWWKVFAIWEGGMAIYGGLLGGILAGWLYARAKKLPVTKLLDLAAPCFALGQAVGRWGNFVNREAHGGLVENPALRFFPVSVEISGAWYYATFFYESMWCLLIVAAVLLAEKKRFLKRSGDGFLLYAFLYALERAVVEGMRTDSLMLGAMRVSQGLSLSAALTAAVVWALRAKRAPMGIRMLAPACVLTAIIFAAAGNGFGLFAAAAAAIAAAAVNYRWMDSTDQNTENRGEGL